MKTYQIRKSAEPLMYELVRISDDAILYCQTIENVENYAMNYEPSKTSGFMYETNKFGLTIK